MYRHIPCVELGAQKVGEDRLDAPKVERNLQDRPEILYQLRTLMNAPDTPADLGQACRRVLAAFKQK
jgi:hypothetical protein